MLYFNLYLSSGATVKVSCEEMDYDSLCQDWEKGSGVLTFEEGYVHAKDVVFIVYLN
jgi:hypothetical protein